MKIFNKITDYCVAFLAASALFGCQQDELVKPSALMCESSLTFEAVEAEPQVLKIFSDADWDVDATVDWIDFTPSSGSQTMEITISVDDNYMEDSKTVNRPREGEIIIKNRTGYSISCLIRQKGDNYIGVKEMTVAQVKGLDDDAYAKIPDVQVMAVADGGFVASDGQTAIYVTSSAKASVGSKVFVAGQKKTLYGMAAFAAGEVTVLSEGKVDYPSPVDLATNLDPANASDVVYVSTLAGILGTSLYYDPALPVTVSVLTPLPGGDIDIEKVNMHNIAANAYFVGIEEGDVKLILTKVEDKGINDVLDAYFYDDFSWMKPLIDASGVKVGDSITENNASADAPNLRSTGALTPLLDELLARGYEDLNQGAKVIYPQRYYWKFGKTSKPAENNNGGMTLPEIEFKGDELVNAYIEFDWAAHMTGSGNIDKVQIVVEVPEGAGLFENGTNVSDPFFTTQEKGHIEWQHAKALLKGASKNSRITIRPYNFASVTPDQQRWHLDNIKVKDTGIPYSDPVYANVTVSEEVLTFEGTPTGPVSFTVKSDNDWTITKGMDTEWFSIDVLQGAANEDVTVTVTCQPSTSVNLRHGTAVIASADTRKNIHIVQSAAGGQLDPLISVKTDKNVNSLLGEGDGFAVTVQSNIDYTVETSAEWLSEIVEPATKALVESRLHSFTCAPNTTGAARSGYVRFRNADEGVEAVVMVTQENFEPRIDITAAGNPVYITADGATIKAHVSANIDFNVESNILTMPTELIPAGEYDYDLIIPAFTGTSREIVLTFKNEKYSYTKDWRVDQLGPEAPELFADDFEWLAPVVAAYKASKDGNYDTVGKHDLKAAAPNIYTTAALKDAVIPKLTEIGYFIPGKDAGANNVLYLQENYLKMGKTGSSSQTSLTMPFFPASGQDVIVSFDWCRMEQGDGTIDNYTITLKIEGSGTFVNGTKYSDELTTPQKQGEMFWTNVAAKIVGANDDTRITVVATALLDKSTGKIDYTKTGGKRMFIDNIKVVGL